MAEVSIAIISPCNLISQMCADETRCPLVAACCPPERAAVSEHRDNSTLVVAGDATSPNDLTTQTTKHAVHLGLTATTGCCARRRSLSPARLRDHRGKSGSCTLHRHAIVFSVRLQATVAANDSFRHHIVSASPSGGTRGQPQFQVYVLVGPVGNCNWRNQVELHTNVGDRVPSSLSAWDTRVKTPGRACIQKRCMGGGRDDGRNAPDPAPFLCWVSHQQAKMEAPQQQCLRSWRRAPGAPSRRG